MGWSTIVPGTELSPPSWQEFWEKELSSFGWYIGQCDIDPIYGWCRRRGHEHPEDVDFVPMRGC